MKTNRILSAALIVMAATACNSDYISENIAGGDLEPMVISGIETKTIFTQTANGGIVNWTAGDRLAIFDNLGGKNIFDNSQAATASFSGNVTAGTTWFWGAYPAEHVQSDKTLNGTLTINLPAEQTPVAGTFAEDLNISVTSGVKTPGTPEVTNITFYNVCGLISFTVPERIAAKKVTFSTESRDIAGTLSVDCENVSATVSGNGSRSVSMEGNFQAGSTFYFVVTTGTISGFRIDVETEKGSLYYQSASKGNIEVKAGNLKNLGLIDFKNGEMTASASHTYSNSKQLTGSSITVAHGIPENMWKDVTSLNVTVSKDNKTYRSFSTTTLDAATVTPTAGNTYLPQGDYNVSCSYTMNGVTTTMTKTVNPGAPDFAGNASVIGITSYSRYLDRETYGDPNALNAETIEKISASCPAVANISEAVLQEMPVSYTIAIDGTAHATGTISSPSTTTVNAADKTGASWGKHTLTAAFTFDGVAINGSSECHITGLPFDYSFVNGSLDQYRSDGWTTNGSLEVSNKTLSNRAKTLMLQHVSAFGADKWNGYIVSPAFYLPSEISEIMVQPSVHRSTYTSSGNKKRIGYIGVVGNVNTSNTSSISYETYGNSNTSGTVYGNGEWLGSMTLTRNTPYVSVDSDDWSNPSTLEKWDAVYYFLHEVHLRYAE